MAKKVRELKEGDSIDHGKLAHGYEVAVAAAADGNADGMRFNRTCCGDDNLSAAEVISGEEDMTAEDFLNLEIDDNGC
jgi:hypothetical protein